ncbi:TetR/AcrR family transcriptional regulator [Demequina phytophila]|uniref:TetR/AcrR family transcriptional regulator n=1 Tax=Demequina phytophila TaxID=1638981 RepID=UPI0007848D6B|nr:TetR family transcriptional regulator [Demequina phytophila]
MRMPLAERRAALVDATLAVVERDGLSGASARTIVTQAGMPLGALHYAFTSIEDLMAAAVDAVTEQERLAVEHLLAHDGTVEEALRAGLTAYVDLLAERPARELAYLELMLHASRVRLDGPPAAGRYAPSYAVVAGLLDGVAARAGATWATPPDVLARHAVAMLDGITTTWLADHDTAAAHATARFLASALAAHAHLEG